MPDETEEKLCWIVVFRKGQLPYTYKYRTVTYMVDVVSKHKERYGVYPHRMWVIVNDEIEKVVIA